MVEMLDAQAKAQQEKARVEMLEAEAKAQQEKARIRHLGEPGAEIPEEECKWACFISHYQAEASHQVLGLGGEIEKQLQGLGKRLTKPWIDKQQKATEEGMHEGVRLSRNFILYMTKGVLTRDFCLNEIRMALQYRKNVILVFQTDPRSGGVPGPFFDYYGSELKKAFPNADDGKWLMRNSYVQFHDRGQHVQVMLHDEISKNGIVDQMELAGAEPVGPIRTE
jgi:hypothetical protein